MDEAVPPLSNGRQFIRVSLVATMLTCAAFGAHLTLLSSLQQRSAQAASFDRFRQELAIGTAPTGPTNESGALLDLGVPVAFLSIPSLGLEQVVGEGTSSPVLFDGPGHRRDSPLPGQEGTSVIFGRRSLFGAPFARIGSLRVGDTIKVTTGQGEFTFEVTGQRRDGDPAPQAAASGTARLTLITAAGSPYLPDGALRVDASLIGQAVGGSPRPFTMATLPVEERLMMNDPATAWALAFWLQALIVVVIGGVWSWNRWGHRQTWIVFAAPLLLVVLATSSEAAHLLPNVM